MSNPQVTFPAYFAPANAVAFANPDSSAQVVSAVTPMPVAVTGATPPGSNLIGMVQPSYLAPAAWASPGTAQDMRAYSSVTVVVTTAPSAAYTPQWSPDGASWYAASGLDLNFNTLTSIATPFTGAVTFQGGGYVRLTGGTGGVFQLSAGQ
ncbi:hypothetical protein [Novosphingobium sp. Chol11]|uniref:hypothetical protein n=1 Tax=Novosphingobium sp. Chol11 TaxID=1385763 RepID=UPI0025CFCB41|nr:hypothetical protein [Novosphingobium sp. Chol11]